MNPTGTIRKIMGWCPNSPAMKRALIALPADEEFLYGRKGIEGSCEMGWVNKYRNFILLQTVVGIAGYVPAMFVIRSLFEASFNQEIILKGILIGIVLSVLAIAYEWKQLNRISLSPVGFMRSIFFHTFTQLAAVFAIIMLLTFTIGNDDPLQFMLSLFFPSLWIHYPLVVYWERKNMKTIYLLDESFLKWRPVAFPDQA